MNKAAVGVIVAILVLAGVGFAVTNKNKNADTKTNTSTNQASNTDSMADMNMSNDTDNFGPNNASNESTTSSEVVIQNSAFSPTKITVKVGTKVTWTNKDSVQHDVAPDKDYGDDFKASELLSKGETYSFTFNKAGTYTYHCTPHPFMKASVVVTE